MGGEIVVLVLPQWFFLSLPLGITCRPHVGQGVFRGGFLFVIIWGVDVGTLRVQCGIMYEVWASEVWTSQGTCPQAVMPWVLRPWVLGACYMDSIAWAKGVHFFLSCLDIPSTCFLPLDRGKTATRWWFSNKAPLMRLRSPLGAFKAEVLQNLAPVLLHVLVARSTSLLPAGDCLPQIPIIPHHFY